MIRIHIDDLCSKKVARLFAKHISRFTLIISTGREIQVQKSSNLVSFSHENGELTQLEELDCSKAQEILGKS